jgi:hypothetical protein
MTLVDCLSKQGKLQVIFMIALLQVTNCEIGNRNAALQELVAQFVDCVSFSPTPVLNHPPTYTTVADKQLWTKFEMHSIFWNLLHVTSEGNLTIQ